MKCVLIVEKKAQKFLEFYKIRINDVLFAKNKKKNKNASLPVVLMCFGVKVIGAH